MSATATMTESSMPIPIPVPISSLTAPPSPSTSPVPFSTATPSPPLLLSRTVLEWPAPNPTAKPGLPALLQLSLTAPGPHTAVFKFKTNAPNRYRVKPSAGTVAPGTSLVVLVQCADISQMRVHTDNLLLQSCFDLSPPDARALTSHTAAAELIRSLPRTQLVEQVLSCAIRRPSLSRAVSPVAGAPPAVALRVPSPVISTAELRRSSFSSIHEHAIDAAAAAALEMRSLSPSPSRLPSPPPAAPSSPPTLSTSPPLRTKPRQRRTSTITGSPILRTTLLSNASSPPPTSGAIRSLSPGAWPARRASPNASTLSPSRASSASTHASHLSLAPPVLAPGQLRATPLAWLLRTLQHVLNKLLGNLLTMALGTFILAGIALTRGSTWLVGVLLAPVCRVAGRVQSGFKVMGKVAPMGSKAGMARSMNASNRSGKVARMFPFGVLGRWGRRDSAAAMSVAEVLDDGEGRVEEHALAL